ncbi:MAG: hypothetical protein ACOY99_00425 [Pseudomonadota bacterium]
MTTMTQPPHTPHDEWLDSLLARPPVIADAGFSAAVTARLAAARRRRRVILCAVTLVVSAVLGIVLPWGDILAWLQEGAAMLSASSQKISTLPDITIVTLLIGHLSFAALLVLWLTLWLLSEKG